MRDQPSKFYWRDTSDGKLLRLNFERDGIAAAVDMLPGSAEVLMRVIGDGLNRVEHQKRMAAPAMFALLINVAGDPKAAPIKTRRRIASLIYEALGLVVNLKPVSAKKAKKTKPVRRHK